MPKLLSSGTYQLKEYSFEDYIRYTYLVNRMKSNSKVSRSGRSMTSTIPLSFTEPNVVSHYIQRLKLLNLRNQEIVPMSYIDDIMAASSNSQAWRVHQFNTFPTTENQEFNNEFMRILDSLTEALYFIYNREHCGWEIEEPAVFSPKTKALEDWDRAWLNQVACYDYGTHWAKRVQTAAGISAVIREIEAEGHKYRVDEDIVSAHIANLKIIVDPNYHNQCMQAFSPTPVVNLAYLLPLHVDSQPGFLLSVYQDPLFQHWLVRAILLALIITAAFVAAAFMVKVAVLPVAVAGFVTGLSKLAANTILGTAVTVGVAATATLVASIHASFFSAEPRDNGGASSVAYSERNQVRA